MYSRCQKCGRKLTDLDSIKRGYGPECWETIIGKERNSCSNLPDDYEVPGQISLFDYENIIQEDKKNG
ncbi:DUF6011 domain-containing protein [Parablautia sp. Marseille-Q6255]|uniref:DUF6011 domain-containing protein n=1 Tax=Parablautia sp. Marseille-Q6255 TaxID=3039593 RepID=UPI0024BCACE0|nr:DUF6011 domain-containing protein [Parablautia sp. Marseille-Q6255]